MSVCEARFCNKPKIHGSPFCSDHISEMGLPTAELERIMAYGQICDCDDRFLCKKRLLAIQYYFRKQWGLE